MGHLSLQAAGQEWTDEQVVGGSVTVSTLR